MEGFDFSSIMEALGPALLLGFGAIAGWLATMIVKLVRKTPTTLDDEALKILVNKIKEEQDKPAE